MQALHADISVDLREPELENGRVFTELGGVIKAPNFRMQAQQISYTKTADCHFVEASGALMVDFGDYVFIGDSLVYDFNEETGIITNGISKEGLWVIRGESIILSPDGNFIVENATLTSTESGAPEWEVYANTLTLTRTQDLTVRNLKMRLFRLPVFWAPSFRVNLSTLANAPISFYTRWGGKQGVRVGARYTLLDIDRFKTYLRFDWRFKRGPGGGVETYWTSADLRQELEMINYYACDNSLEDLKERRRYRFQGAYSNHVYDDRGLAIYASWDKLSDKDMATDYQDRGIQLDTAERTELLVRKENPWWISNFSTRVRINSFQTVKQELPSFLFSQRPYMLGSSGIFLENEFEASYLDFKYSNGLINVSDYSSSRILHDFRLFSPLHFRNWIVTPKMGATYAFYGDSYADNAKFLLLGYGGVKAHTNFYKVNGRFKQVLTPYVDWEYLSAPTVNPDDHYIFDIYDGLWRLSRVKTGIQHDLLYKDYPDIRRLVSTELYTYLFIDSAPISKLYANITLRPISTLRQSFETGWDFKVNRLNHFNFINEWTVSDDLAVSLEWRHRSKYAWRKAVYDNFMLDSFRPIRELLDSSVSDRRDTLLCHLFWRLHPQFAMEFRARHGWRRQHEPSYTEFEFNAIQKLRSNWSIKYAYSHTEADDRIALYFSLDMVNPKDSPCLITPIAF